jgi:hypothetical protein
MITVFILMDINFDISDRYEPIKVFANEIEAQNECKYLDPDGIKGTYVEEVEYING